MNVWPLRFRKLNGPHLLFSDEAGSFFASNDAFLGRYALDQLTDDDFFFLETHGHAYLEEGDLAHTAFAARWSQRNSSGSELSYVIVVPTLRCDLNCSYCQVSRASIGATGYDWSEETANDVITFLDGLNCSTVKVEFQGGEPLLRLDLLIRVRDFCRLRFQSCEFVVCTNLQSVSGDAWRFLKANDTFVSTSLDGLAHTHARQRTGPAGATQFFDNLAMAIEQLGSSRVSALPTINQSDPPDFDELIDTYEGFGLQSIYLRPVNYQGFARKGHSHNVERWNRLHRRFIEHLLTRNFHTGRIVEEYYFSQCLKRVLRPREDGHVDLRNPNLFGSSYVLIDHQGLIFPTDEARMLHRIGHIDLSIGDVRTGLDHHKLNSLNSKGFNNFDPDCIHCPYQAFCGSDPIDDLSRYDRVDLSRHATWFCNRQTAVFDHVFELLYRSDEKTRFSLAHWAGIAEMPPELAPVHR